MRVRQRSYLNVILTVNAVLLAGLLWTQIAAQPLTAQTAVAQSRSYPNRTQPTPRMGVPNAAKQREAIVEGLREVKQSVDATRKIIESGRLRVEVTNLDDIEVTVE